MEAALPQRREAEDGDQRIADTIRQERPRLGNFIRKYVGDATETEDLLQDVFYEFIEASRLMQPIEKAGAWLFRVARNKIIDRLRKKRPQLLPDPQGGANTEDGGPGWEDLLPSADAGPEAVFARSILFDELDAALDELPAEQREVFLAHEVDGRSFKDMAADTGVSVTTLLSRKHYAVLHLRRRLRAIYEEFKSEWRL